MTILAVGVEYDPGLDGQPNAVVLYREGSTAPLSPDDPNRIGYAFNCDGRGVIVDPVGGDRRPATPEESAAWARSYEAGEC